MYLDWIEGELAGDSINITRQTSLLLFGEVSERDSQVKLLTLGNHAEPHRAASHDERLFAPREDDFDVQLCGHWKERRANAPQTPWTEVFGQRFDNMRTTRLVQPNRTVRSNTLGFPALLAHASRLARDGPSVNGIACAAVSSALQ